MVSKEEAKEAVLKLATEYGYIRDLTEGLDRNLRAELDARFLKLETVAAKSVKT